MPYEAYVDNWRKAMGQAHQLASEKATKTSTKGKRQFDKKVRAIQLKTGEKSTRNWRPRENKSVLGKGYLHYYPAEMRYQYEDDSKEGFS